MAFSCGRRIGGLIRQTISTDVQSPITSLLNSTRSMSTTKIFVGGIPPWIKEPVLKEAFSGFGDVAEAIVVRNTETGEAKGFGFVMFYDVDSAESAMDGMDGQVVSGRTLRVRPATSRSR